MSDELNTGHRCDSCSSTATNASSKSSACATSLGTTDGYLSNPRCKGFTWQAGYGAFSLGQSNLADLVRYIDNQREHHRSKSFREELLDLLRKYEVEYNEQYLWD